MNEGNIVSEFVKANKEANVALQNEKSRFVKCLWIKYKCLLAIIGALILLVFLAHKYFVDEEMKGLLKDFVKSNLRNHTINITT